MKSFIKLLLSVSIILNVAVLQGFAQDPQVKSVYDQFDRLETVSPGEIIEMKVGESLGVFSDTDDIVDRYDSSFEGAYLEAAYLFFSDGTTNHSDSKYVSISHTAPKDDINALYALKPTPGYIDMIIYYVIAYFDKKGTTRVASGDYSFKVKVVGNDGGGSASLQNLSLPEEITIREFYDYLLTPTIKPLDAVTTYEWKSSDQGIAFTLAGDTAIELGQGQYFSENVSLYVTEKDCCIRARNEGTATVTVTTAEGLTASVKVKVIPSEISKADVMDVVDEIYNIVEDSLSR